VFGSKSKSGALWAIVLEIEIATGSNQDYGLSEARDAPDFDFEHDHDPNAEPQSVTDSSQ
jgi:hypothetical protein